MGFGKLESFLLGCIAFSVVCTWSPCVMTKGTRNRRMPMSNSSCWYHFLVSYNESWMISQQQQTACKGQVLSMTHTLNWLIVILSTVVCCLRNRSSLTLLQIFLFFFFFFFPRAVPVHAYVMLAACSFCNLLQSDMNNIHLGGLLLKKTLIVIYWHSALLWEIYKNYNFVFLMFAQANQSN